MNLLERRDNKTRNVSISCLNLYTPMNTELESVLRGAVHFCQKSQNCIFLPDLGIRTCSVVLLESVEKRRIWRGR